MKLIACVAALLVCVTCAAAEPPWRDRLGYAAGELWRVEIGKFGYPVVRGSVDQKPVSFVFDTGNMSGILLAPGTIDELRLSSARTTRTYDSSGRELGRIREFTLGEVRIFGRTFQRQSAVEDPRGDLAAFAGPKYVMNGRFTLDYGNEWMAVSNRPLPQPLRGSTPLLLSDEMPGMIVISAAANGVPVLFQLDTGKSRTCIDPELVRRLRLPSDAAGVHGLTVTIGDRDFAIPAAKEIGLGGISAGYPARILVGVGSDVLSKGLLTVDYISRTVTFESPPASDRRSPP